MSKDLGHQPPLVPALGITFDTNTLDRVSRPARFPKDSRQTEYLKIHEAIKTGRVEGFFCETLVTLEGVQNKDRIAVFGGTRIRSEIRQAAPNAHQITLSPEQPDRQDLHPEQVSRIQAALALGIRVLKAPPRVGGIRLEHSDANVFLQDRDDANLAARLDRSTAAAEAMEARGLGQARAASLSQQFANRAKTPNMSWLQGLSLARDIHEENAVKRAIAEWADGDSIAAHIGYGIDFFCSEDKGNGAGAASVFDDTNRQWLSTAYGVKFLTLTELATMI
jgi:hypothetical protein